MNQEDVVMARDWIAAAQSIAVLTGAGISAASGVPTFRGSDGLWRNFRAEDLATPEAFARDPKLVWQWYDWRRGLVSACKPNPAHIALTELQRQNPRFKLITQNVDGLHDLAGTEGALKLHGDLWHLRCTGCDHRGMSREVPLVPLPPLCPQCGGLLRPDVVWFGEMLDEQVWQDARENAGQCDLFLVIGTSAVVQPAASLPMEAHSSGAKVIEVNLEPTPLSASADLSLLGTAAEVVPALLS